MDRFRSVRRDTERVREPSNDPKKFDNEWNPLYYRGFSIHYAVCSVAIGGWIGAVALAYTYGGQLFTHDATTAPSLRRSSDIPDYLRDATELYGTGVRVGIYLQVVAMLISTVCCEFGRIRLPYTASMLGLLWALTQFALRGICSAFEAHIAISLVAAMTFAGLPVFFASERTDSFGDVILGTCNFWAALLGAMFWTKGKRGSASQLMLGLARSNSYVWFFGKVELADNWLPRAMEAFFILLLLPVFVIVLKVWVDGIRKLWRGQSHDGPRRDNQQEPVAGGPFQGLREYYVRSVQPASIFLYTFVGLGALILVFTIVSVEMTIQYNQPELESEFWSLSQTLPLAIGVVVGGDGLILLWKTYRKVGGKKVDGRFGGAAESLLRERGGTGGS